MEDYKNPTEPVDIDGAIQRARLSLTQVTGFQKLFRWSDINTTTVTKGASATSGSTTVTHNLGYVPGLVAYIYDGTTYFPMEYTKVQLSGATSGIVNLHAFAKPSMSNIVFTIETPDAGSLYASALTYSIRYYLTIQTAN